jgi:hypothetical protein
VRGAAAFWKELVAEGRKVLTALMHTSSTKEIIIAYSTAVVPSRALMSWRSAAVVCPIFNYRARNGWGLSLVEIPARTRNLGFLLFPDTMTETKYEQNLRGLSHFGYPTRLCYQNDAGYQNNRP